MQPIPLDEVPDWVTNYPRAFKYPRYYLGPILQSALEVRLFLDQAEAVPGPRRLYIWYNPRIYIVEEGGWYDWMLHTVRWWRRH